jgi:hypothetical protein
MSSAATRGLMVSDIGIGTRFRVWSTAPVPDTG